MLLHSFDKKGTGRIPVEHLGDLLRAVGQNPTLAEISELQQSIKTLISISKLIKKLLIVLMDLNL